VSAHDLASRDEAKRTGIYFLAADVHADGYVALFEIEDASTVTVLAVRHQLEDDYH
jgi:ParE toxin of type II toxin-antitoxin system, parDE